MRFRPCIDIHNGCVKQIVGSSLRDEGDLAAENFVADKSAAWYAALFRRDGLAGGHVIMLNGRDSAHFQGTEAAALEALAAWPGGLQLGGGITADNAGRYLEAGAERVIVTSYVFRGGRIDYAHLDALVRAVGRDRLVLDLSCRQREEDVSRMGEEAPYYIMTDRWQVYTDTALTPSLMEELSAACGEFLVHGISAEGKRGGPDRGLLSLLSRCALREAVRPITYAGGIRTLADLDLVEEAGGGRLDCTVGSALDLYGGSLPYETLRRRR